MWRVNRHIGGEVRTDTHGELNFIEVWQKTKKIA